MSVRRGARGLYWLFLPHVVGLRPMAMETKAEMAAAVVEVGVEAPA